MTFEPGTRLGRYEIRSKLGKGGMGDVYLARDRTINRDVALKVLPTNFSSDRERLRRFKQEAQAAASLNHPNIAHIYEIGQGNGINYIAMEFVDGYTLRELIHRRQTDLTKLLRYLQHAAEGLAKAHAAGIVHRDLKPDNVMVSREGNTKILDFGLAKLVERYGDAGTEGHGDTGTDRRGEDDPTVAMPRLRVSPSPRPVASTPGVIMGTVGYMSPEQAQGKTTEIDHRSDIFSFGCILYEAVTGQKPFPGKDTIDSLNKIIREAPASIASLNPTAPPDLQRIVRRCLAKDPEERYQAMKDVAIEIKEVRRELQNAAGMDTTVPPPTSSVTSAVSTGPTSAVTSLSSSPATQMSSAEYLVSQLGRHKKAFLIVLAVVGIGVIAAAYAVYKFSSKDQPVAASRQMKISRLVTGAGSVTNASISPDGKYVAYAVNKEGKVSLRVKQISSGSDREILPPVDRASLRATVFSKDSELIYYNLYHRENNPWGTLYQIPVIGGEPKKILDNLQGIITFAPDGKRFAFFRQDQNSGDSFLMTSSLGGGEPREIARRSGQDWFIGIPAWSPDGKVIVCSVGTDTGGTRFTLMEFPADGGTPKAITSHYWRGAPFRPSWLKDGTGLMVNTRELPSSPTQISHVSYPEGVVTRITNDLTQYGNSSFGVTDDASTMVSIIEDNSNRVWLASAGAEEGRARKLTNGKDDGQFGIDVAPDGKVVYVTKTGDDYDIWIMNADGSGQKQLTSNADIEESVTVSQNGRYIVFHSFGAGTVSHIWRMDMDGGNSKQLTSGEFADLNPICSPDNQWVVFLSWRSGKPRAWKVSVDGGDPVQVNDLPFEGRKFLSDGKLIFGIYFDEQVNPPKQRGALVPFDGGPPTKIFDLPAGSARLTLGDDRTVLYIERNGDIDNIWSKPLDGGQPKQLTKFTSEYIFRGAPSRANKQFAVSRGTSSADVILIKDFR